MASELRRIGGAAGLDAFGIASAEPFVETRRVLEARRSAGLDGGMQFTYRNPALSTEPQRTVPGARSIVVGARSYLRADPQPEPGTADGPTTPRARVARFAWSDQYAGLRSSLAPVAEALRARGFRAMVLVDDNRMVDRAAAHRAGLGWYGKNTTLLLPGLGSWFVLGSVLTDAPLPVDEPVADGCGSCDRCRPACPTGALSEPGALDGRLCLAWLVQAPGVFPRDLREAVGDRIYGCDDCQEVCPVNRLAARRDPPPAPSADDMPTVDVIELLEAGDDEILARWGRWYIAERAPRWLRRNALIVLGNSGDPDDRRVLTALTRALRAADPMVRAHAVWSAARLGRRDLLVGLPPESDPDVRAELAAAGSVPARQDRAPTMVDVDDPPIGPDRHRPVDPSIHGPSIH